MYYVAGGIFTDTDFKILSSNLELHGPYDNLHRAVEIWRSSSQHNVDICEHRMFIVQPYTVYNKQYITVGDSEFPL